MKFYSRILGDREYSLFEVVHAGLGLPATISKFGDIFPASVSDYVSLKTDLKFLTDDDEVTNATKMELFSQRGTLARAQTISADDLRDHFFCAFWRLFNVRGGKISRRDKEAIVAITGTGWPSHAAGTHQIPRFPWEN